MATSARLTPQSASEKQSTVSLAKAKATLSAVIDGVEQRRIPVTILRRGIPVAQIVPFPDSPAPSLLGSMAGTGQELGDIVSPYLDEWTIGDE
jgi:prevent-host-death family protein